MKNEGVKLSSYLLGCWFVPSSIKYSELDVLRGNQFMLVAQNHQILFLVVSVNKFLRDELKHLLVR